MYLDPNRILILPPFQNIGAFSSSDPTLTRVGVCVLAMIAPPDRYSFYLSTHARPVRRIVARIVEDRSSQIPPNFVRPKVHERLLWLHDPKEKRVTRGPAVHFYYCRGIFSDKSIPFALRYYHWTPKKRNRRACKPAGRSSLPSQCIHSQKLQEEDDPSIDAASTHERAHTTHPRTYLPTSTSLTPDRSDSRSVIIVLNGYCAGHFLVKLSSSLDCSLQP